MKSVLLLSDRSSGSSALFRELSKHPEIRSVKETGHRQNETLYWNKAAAVLNMPLADINYSIWPIRRAQAKVELLEFLASNLPDFTPPDDDEELVFQGWHALCERFGPVFLEKSPHHVHDRSALRIMLKAMERLQDVEFLFIGLVRNPMDTLYSMWCRWRAVPEVSQSDWLRAYNNLLWFRGRVEEKTFMLKYEDLIEHPDRVMKDICGFLSLEWLPELGEGLHRNSMNKWRNDPLFGFQPEEQVKTLGRHLGYSSAELHAPDRRLWPFYRRMLVATYPGVQLYRKQRRRLASLMRPR